MASSTASVLNRGKPPVLIEGVASTTLTLGSSSNYRVNSASGSQSVTTINLPNVRAGHEIVLIGTSDTNYLSLATGGNIKVPVTRALLDGVAIQLKYDGTYWCEMGSGIDSAGAATTLLDGLTAGTIVASKAVTVDSNKDASAFRNVVVTNLDAGASGTAGTVDVFPSTASRGKLSIAWVNTSSGNHTTTITNAAQGGAYTYTIPEIGASSEFAMLAGTQSFTGAKTFGLFTTFTAGIYAFGNSTSGSDAISIGTATATGFKIKQLAATFSATTIPTTGLDLAADLPTGAVVRSVQLLVSSAYTGGGTSVGISIGPTASKDKYGDVGTLTTNSVINTHITSLAVLGSDEDVRIWPTTVALNGTVGDTNLTLGSCKIQIVYELLVSLT